MGHPTNLNDDMFGVLALSAASLPASDPVIAATRDHLLRYQNADGSWGYARGWAGSADTTGAAVAAVVAAGVPASDAAVTRALAWLKAQQVASGGFPMEAGGKKANLQSTAWVLWGLKSAGEDVEGPACGSGSGARTGRWAATG